MEKDKILKTVLANRRNPFRILLQSIGLMDHTYYKAYIILRVMRGTTEWQQICALTGLLPIYSQQIKELWLSKSIRYKTKNVQQRNTGHCIKTLVGNRGGLR